MNSFIWNTTIAVFLIVAPAVTGLIGILFSDPVLSASDYFINATANVTIVMIRGFF